MSREGARCRARAQARYLEEILGVDPQVSLLGYQLVVLSTESHARAPLAGSDVPVANRPRPFLMLVELPGDDDPGSGGAAVATRTTE